MSNGTLVPRASPDGDGPWKPLFFRLFLSHSSRQAVQVSKLKKELLSHGIDGFVAHEDIEPTKEWQATIDAGASTVPLRR